MDRLAVIGITIGLLLGTIGLSIKYLLDAIRLQLPTKRIVIVGHTIFIFGMVIMIMQLIELTHIIKANG